MSIEIYRNSDTVTFPEPEFGDEERLAFNQTWGQTDSGKYFFENHGYETAQRRWSFIGIKDTEKRELEAFARDITEGGVYTFSIKWENEESTLIKRTIFCDMEYGGSTIVCDDTIDAVTIYCDQETGPDYIFYHRLRMIDDGFAWRSVRGGWWDLVWTFMQEPE